MNSGHCSGAREASRSGHDAAITPRSPTRARLREGTIMRAESPLGLGCQADRPFCIETKALARVSAGGRMNWTSAWDWASRHSGPRRWSGAPSCSCAWANPRTLASPSPPSRVTTESIWRNCNICNSPIAFGADYFRCSVARCDRKPLECSSARSSAGRRMSLEPRRHAWATTERVCARFGLEEREDPHDHSRERGRKKDTHGRTQ